MISVDFEAHFYTQAAFDYLSKRSQAPRFTPIDGHDGSYNLWFTDQISLFQNDAFIKTLCDLDTQRIAAMDKADLTYQILSFSSPGADEFYPDTTAASEFATAANAVIHDAMQRHPNRFLGFATLSPYDVPAAVKELEHCVQTLKFSGWLAHANFGEDLYLDNKTYWPLLEAAESLGVPIFIHPTVPLNAAYGKYGFALGGPPLGFQFETALCALRMIYAGVFDQFPNLKIVLGHMGETLPFLMPERIDWAYANPNVSQLQGFIDERPNIKRTPCEVLKENFYIGTSGRFSKPLMDYCLQIMGEDHILLATDYPYENLQQSMDFIRNCGLSDTALKKICYQNATNLGLNVNSK